MTQIPSCRVCGEAFGEWTDLAKHIVKLKDVKHKKGRRWALKFLSNAKYLNQKKDAPVRTKLTEQDKDNKTSTIRELSGENEIVNTVCPGLRCHLKGRAALPVEHAGNPDAWKIGDRFVIYCNACRG